MCDTQGFEQQVGELFRFSFHDPVWWPPFQQDILLQWCFRTAVGIVKIAADQGAFAARYRPSKNRLLMVGCALLAMLTFGLYWPI